MTTSDRIEQQSFCYDPDFPPDVAEGEPLVAATGPRPPTVAPVRRALRACGDAAAALVRRTRSEP
jgi:hypothetical protein